MPDEMPAEVKMSPSRTKIASGSTVTSGKARANNRVSCQCVVARRPLSTPACARMNDPVQMDASRRVRADTERMASTRAGSMACAGSWSLPATRTVSAESIAAMLSVTPSRAPIELVTSHPSSDAILTW